MLKHSCIFNICNPPKWEVFNLPPKTNVRYSVVFNQKRDFQQSVEKLTEAPNYSKMSSCCIVDNSVYSSMNSKNMDIIFFDGSECCSCLSLRLFFHKQLLMKKSNSLLVFLNKFLKGGIYKLQNTCMYIKCMDGLKWALFYDLFEFLIKSSGKSIMGALFYIHFVCKDLIFKELCFLQSINKNPTHFSSIRTNNFQARKTKGSETIGILSKRQFGIKVCSEYKFKVAKREVLAKKGKLIDADPVHKCKFLKYQKFSQKICCRCKENKWQFFKSLVKCATRNYTDILEAKGILNELETTVTNSMDTSICSNTILKVVNAGVMDTNLIPVPSKETTVTLSNLTKVPLMWKPYHTVSETINEVGTIMENIRNENVHHNAPDKSINEENTKLKNDILQDSFGDLGNIQSIYSEHISDNTDHKKRAIKQGNVNSLKIFSEKTKCYEKNDSFVTFQTANGKPLNISEKALQTAQKMYREVCSQVINTAKNEQNSSFENLQEKDYNYKHDSGFPCAFKSNLSKEYFDNIDNALVDKFFEEIPFDEKVDCKPYSQPGQPSLVQSNTSYKSQSGKVRKSLGGRRSLKPYIKKLS